MRGKDNKIFLPWLLEREIAPFCMFLEFSLIIYSLFQSWNSCSVAQSLGCMVLQAPLSKGFSWDRYWSRYHSLLQRICDQGDYTHVSCVSCKQAGSLPLATGEAPLEISGQISTIACFTSSSAFLWGKKSLLVKSSYC